MTASGASLPSHLSRVGGRSAGVLNRREGRKTDLFINWLEMALMRLGI
jgi:hypothetical protein